MVFPGLLDKKLQYNFKYINYNKFLIKYPGFWYNQTLSYIVFIIEIIIEFIINKTNNKDW